ncbi:MAG TPA: hypothetical protein VGR72_06655 [Candidatus Acidoferrales bacterium]|nr:hypothetical protein [Candidatus Acidoferrales bacterium]HEV2340531.1 hypothetical protein [Candidatus Acidoferrales bacterium]
MRNILCAPRLAALLLLASAPVFAATTIPAGTAIPIRLNQAVSSKDAKNGQKVAAEVSRDVMVDGKIVIPRGSDAAVHVAEAVPSGRLSTPAKLYLRLDSVTVHGKVEKLSAHLAGETGKSHKKRNEVGVGGGAAAGAIIGAIAGGGKGAAIGAAAGAGAGTAGAAATGKKDITFAAESTLSFRLRTPLTVH